MHLPAPSDDSAVLTAAAVRLMRQLFRPGCRYWKAGVMLQKLQPASQTQYGLFDPAPQSHDDRKRVMQTMDAINATWGRGTLGMGTAGFRKPRRWSMQRQLLSPRYTTRWDELPVVHA